MFGTSVFHLIPGACPDASAESATSTEKDSKIHRSEFWFEDGNVILQAASTQFRVHRGIIALHSPVFKGMFPIPRPENEPLVDGCPLVHVFDDPEDWTNLLDVMYNSPKAYKSQNATFPIKLLIAMLRLGQKYEFDDFRDDALERLKATFPKNLDEYEASLDAGDIDDESSPRSGQVSTKGNEFEILNIALELGIQTILPMTYLTCIRDQPIVSIFEGQKRKDGSTVNLSPAPQSTLVLGRVNFLDTLITEQCGWLKGSNFIPSENCGSQYECTQARTEILENAFFVGIDLTLNPYINSLSTSAENLCEKCHSVAQERYDAGRKEIWKELPSYFMLPAWEDLKDFEL